jgi:hypothetical protein
VTRGNCWDTIADCPTRLCMVSPNCTRRAGVGARALHRTTPRHRVGVGTDPYGRIPIGRSCHHRPDDRFELRARHAIAPTLPNTPIPWSHHMPPMSPPLMPPPPTPTTSSRQRALCLHQLSMPAGGRSNEWRVTSVPARGRSERVSSCEWREGRTKAGVSEWRVGRPGAGVREYRVTDCE